MGKPLRVLIIEDSEDDTQLLLRELRRLGYDIEFERVETADAMRVVLTEKIWDLILSDYSLPLFNALRALEVLKGSGLDVPFIIISGTIGEEAAIAALKAGAHDFLVKGNFAKLGPAIERELYEAEVRREQMQTEHALQTSEELFGTAFHNSPVGICITTLDGRLQNISQSLLDMLGYTQAELQGKHFNDITHPDDLEIGKDAIGRMMSGQTPSVSFEKRYLHKTGEPIWALVSSSLLRDSSGQPVHFITHILNMTERKLAEEQIHAHAARLKVLADASQTFATALYDYQAMLKIVARQTAEVMGGFCGVRLLSEDGEWLEMVAVHDVDPVTVQFARKLSNQRLRADEPNFFQRVLHSEQAFLIPAVSEAQMRAVVKPEHSAHLKYIASHSRLLAPIRTWSETLGFLIIGRRSGSPAFDEQDLSLAQDLADRAALAISNARLFKRVQNELTDRKQAEDRFRLTVESAPNAMLLVNPEGIIEMVNSQTEKFFGYDRTELIGINVDNLVPEGLRKVHLNHRQSFFANPQTRSMGVGRDLRGVRKNGSEFPVEIGLTPIATPSGMLVMATIVDITERKRAEKALRESQVRLSGIIESAKDAIITIDEEQRITLFNPAAEQIFGHLATHIVGQPLDVLLPERFRPIHRKHVSTFGETDITRRTMGTLGVLSGLRANSEEFPIEASISHLEAAGKKYYTVILRDISERQRAQEAVLESEARYQRVLDAMMEGCQIIDFDWRYLYVNDVVAAQGKSAREDLLNHTMMEVYPGIENTELFAILRQCMEERTPRRMENQFVFPDGSLGWFELSIQPAREGIFILSTDITERKQAEEALRAKNEEIKIMSQQLWQAAKLATMGELAASIAHELNNPLATVSLRVEMLQAQYSPDDPQSKSLQVMDSEIKRMGNLVTNLLQFSRRSSSQISTIKVNEEVIGTLELIQYHLRKNSILTVQQLSFEIPLIQADRQQLRQVFLNLFTNAADAMPMGGLLTICTWSGEKPEAGITVPLRRSETKSLGLPVSELPQVFIEVSDTGEGIPPEKLDRVWEPFYTTKPEGKGTGLGLAICRRIIQEHGGTIEIISDGIPGRGTTVRLSLPAVKER
jgi:PAS domain S-box-containing protein